MQRRILGAAVMLAAMTGSWASTKQPTLADAQHAYHLGQYRHSLALFESLASRNNAEAAECAGFMLLMGEPMYGTQVKRDVERARELLTQAAGAGRAGAGFLLNMVERTD
jgi:TPR repeat protein